MNITKLLSLVMVAMLLSGCVSKKKFEELSGEKDSLGARYAQLKADNQKLDEQLKQCNGLSTRQENDLNSLKAKYDQLEATCAKDATRLSELQVALKQKEIALKEKEDRINSLQNIIAEKDSAANSLVKNLRKALISFQDDELSIEMRQGMVYVSISDKLLYKSGSVTIEPRAVEALGKLASVINKHQDIDIIVEGHTDNVPIKTACMKDNWDLSVSRATAVSRILIWKYEVAPTRITAAGKGEHHPVAENDTQDGRKLNRRTEIILTPKLDELYNLLEKKM
ncbi:MAG: OmpA family protein [Chitinophagales bacterium]|nr:OmpA family protein [Chitinophagales bacterium]